jgi:hypothetical protein
VRQAVDRKTGALVDARSARHGIAYECGCCEAPVVIVRAETIHFAHRKGRARPDCEQYVVSEIRYSGRPQRPKEHTELESTDVSYLSFTMSPEGPELSLRLPAVTSNRWPGTVRLVASSTRTLGYSHIGVGATLAFALTDGQWTLSAIGEVAEEYLARITLGRQSLEFERNLFRGESGRQLGPSDAVFLGETIWWVRRDAAQLNSELDRVGCVLIYEAFGWRVYSVTLPMSAGAQDLATYSQWLQRRVKPRLPSVWVSTPWPRQESPDKTLVFWASDGPIGWRTSEAVHFELRDAGGKSELAPGSPASEFSWTQPKPGEWIVYVNEVRRGLIRVLAEKPDAQSLAVVSIAGKTTGIEQLQSHTDRALAAGDASLDCSFQFGSKTLAEMLEARGNLEGDDPLRRNATLRPGSHLNLGHALYVRWPEAAPRLVTRVKESKPSALARWLLSIGSPVRHEGYISMLVPTRLTGRDPIFERMSRLAWPMAYVAQVRSVEKTFRELE